MADMGKVRIHINIIFHKPFFIGVLLAFANPTKDATSMWDPDKGIF